MEGKPGRPVPPKPAPYVQQTPLPSAVPLVLTPAHHTPSSGASPVTGRKLPPSGPPPPPPPRVDLGEASDGVVCSLKENRSDGITKKGSPKLKYNAIQYNKFLKLHCSKLIDRLLFPISKEIDFSGKLNSQANLGKVYII